MTLMDRDDASLDRAGADGQAMGGFRTVLAQHPLFSRLGEAASLRLAAQARLRSFAPRQPIYARGEAAGAFYAVASGAVRIRARARSGGEIVHSVVQPGETFGEISMLDGRGRSADAVAAARTQVWEIERAAVEPLIAAQTPLAMHLALLLCERLRRCGPQVEDAMFLNTGARLAKAILRLAQPNGGLELRVRATQKELGDMIGLSRESTNKQIQIWVRQNWMSTEKGALTIRDAAALAAFAHPVVF